MARHGRLWPAVASQDWPWPSWHTMAAYGWPGPHMVDHGLPWPETPGHVAGVSLGMVGVTQ